VIEDSVVVVYTANLDTMRFTLASPARFDCPIFGRSRLLADSVAADISAHERLAAGYLSYHSSISALQKSLRVTEFDSMNLDCQNSLCFVQ
jgi:hypothetical protein